MQSVMQSVRQFHGPSPRGKTGTGNGEAVDGPGGIVTVLESRLAGSDGPRFGARLAEQFAQAQRRLEQCLQRGLPPDRFAIVLACAEALRAARTVLVAQSGGPLPQTDPHPLLSSITFSRN